MNYYSNRNKMCSTHGESTSSSWTAINAGQELARKKPMTRNTSQLVLLLATILFHAYISTSQNKHPMIASTHYAVRSQWGGSTVILRYIHRLWTSATLRGVGVVVFVLVLLVLHAKSCLCKFSSQGLNLIYRTYLRWSGNNFSLSLNCIPWSLYQREHV